VEAFTLSLFHQMKKDSRNEQPSIEGFRAFYGRLNSRITGSGLETGKADKFPGVPFSPS
jgi:hypothetical protein